MKKQFNRALGIIALILIALFGYYLYDTLRERSVEEKLAEIIHLEDSRSASRRLQEYLSDPAARIRERAALAIGRIGGRNAGRLLFGLIEGDESLDVSSTAAFAIGLTDEKEYAAKLLDIAFDLPGRVSAQAVLSAGRLADSSMMSVHNQLTRYLKHPSPEVREATCMAIYLADAELSAPALFDIFNIEHDEEVKIAALYALARLGVSQGAPIYEDYLADADPFVRSTAVRGLSHVDTDESTHLLAIAVNDSDAGVAAQAIAMLGNRDSKEAKRQLLRKLERADDEKIIVAILNALRAQENDGAVDIVYNIIEATQSDYVASAAVRYLAQFQRDRAVNLIDSLATVGVPLLKMSCAEAYGIIGDGSVIPRLSRLFTDDNPSVRNAAFRALMTVDSTNYDYYIQQALSDSDYVMVASGIEKIRELRLDSYLPRLERMMDNGRNLNIDVRRALVELAGTFLGMNPQDTIAKQILVYGAIDAEYIVRRDAARIYKDVLAEDRSDIVRQPYTTIPEGDIESALEKYKTNPYATIYTSRGEVEMELFFDVAPLTVLNFIKLAKDGFYDGLIFHRVVPNFVAQGGDPRGDGWGGAPYFIRCEYSEEKYRRGTVGIATSGKDTGSSQFFITLSPQPHLEARYTVFGQVIAGMEHVDRIVIGDVIEEIKIEDNTH